MQPLIKICGITNTEDALSASKQEVWALGFVFAKSPRRVSIEKAREIIKDLPSSILKVGVFVNESIDEIKKIVEFCKLDMVQLHGEESPDTCKELKHSVKVIKAFRVKDETDLKKIPSYDVDLYLLDTYSDKACGGTGETFNWNLALQAKAYGKKIILAGGLRPENVKEAIDTVSPYAIDVSTGVEKLPGKKDKSLMKELISKVKKEL